MKNKVLYFVVAGLIVYCSTLFVQAAMAPGLVINDSSKICQMYSPNAREELLPGWHNAGYGLSDLIDTGAKKVCDSLGYTLRDDQVVAKTKTILATVNIVFYIVFIIAAYILFRLLVSNNKKKYAKFCVSLIVLIIVLNFLHSYTIYQIEPCASGWSIC
jgi:hypothetical protein